MKLPVTHYIQDLLQTAFGKEKNVCYRAYMKLEENLSMFVTPIDKCICVTFRSGVEQLYMLSYMWYTAVGLLVTLVVGLAVSIATSKLRCCVLTPSMNMEIMKNN